MLRGNIGHKVQGQRRGTIATGVGGPQTSVSVSVGAPMPAAQENCWRLVRIVCVFWPLLSFMNQNPVSWAQESGSSESFVGF